MIKTSCSNAQTKRDLFDQPLFWVMLTNTLQVPADDFMSRNRFDLHSSSSETNPAKHKRTRIVNSFFANDLSPVYSLRKKSRSRVWWWIEADVWRQKETHTTKFSFWLVLLVSPLRDEGPKSRQTISLTRTNFCERTNFYLAYEMLRWICLASRGAKLCVCCFEWSVQMTIAVGLLCPALASSNGAQIFVAINKWIRLYNSFLHTQKFAWNIGLTFLGWHQI